MMRGGNARGWAARRRPSAADGSLTLAAGRVRPDAVRKENRAVVKTVHACATRHAVGRGGREARGRARATSPPRRRPSGARRERAARRGRARTGTAATTAATSHPLAPVKPVTDASLLKRYASSNAMLQAVATDYRAGAAIGSPARALRARRAAGDAAGEGGEGATRVGLRRGARVCAPGLLALSPGGGARASSARARRNQHRATPRAQPPAAHASSRVCLRPT
jgi:hypothetical protein